MAARRRSGPIVVKRNGKTFLRKRPKRHRIYVDKPTFTKKEKDEQRKIMYHKLAMGAVNQVGSHEVNRSRELARAGVGTSADFHRAVAGQTASTMSNMHTYDLNQREHEIRKAGIQRQVRRHPNFRNAKVNDSFWHGLEVKKGPARYNVKTKSIFNKRKWNGGKKK